MTVDDQLQHLKGDKDQAGLEGTDVIDACILWVISRLSRATTAEMQADSF